MAKKLKTTTDALIQKEEALTELAVSLQKEARRRSEALQELKKSEQRFKYLAQHDPLTDLLNRRSFFSFAEMALESASSLNKTCFVCLLDVDDFKQFNDTFGHIEGDRALQHVVMHSLNALRQTDIMGRYGGEEFIFLLTGVEEAHGYSAAERIRLAIEKHAFSLENGGTVSLTASIGVTVITPDKETNDFAPKLRLGITQADAALYEAKARGKNQVCMATFLNANAGGDA
jgi:diguanylate cyclase (GGDEF)-like protein